MPPVRLYQIAYSAASLAAVEPGYELLDNLDNARPDWFEYWPIRRFLQQQALRRVEGRLQRPAAARERDADERQ